jgi:hypothetical protein
LLLAAVVSAALLGAQTARAAQAKACPSAHPKQATLYCHGTATFKLGAKVRHYTNVSCTVEVTSDAPVQVFAKDGFLLKTLFDRHKRQTSTGELLTLGGKTGVIDVSVKAKLQANRRNGTFVGTSKTPKVSGSFTCK